VEVNVKGSDIDHVVAVWTYKNLKDGTYMKIQVTRVGDSFKDARLIKSSTSLDPEFESLVRSLYTTLSNRLVK